ncbi:DUF3290 family protein [Isobaculum melis]|uniref:DUF3290 domain-containing protein n=1 Tax=Isobaculum melis TaxID=142588 RepID=A0A1H9R5F8_9LACT|nr:DUF3290 family protein [Isobaculum melis]SER67837.1 Protein of unknown function [Isobaculum melis]
MNFYTYDNLNNQTHAINFIQVTIIAILAIILLVLIIQWMRKKLDYKYKEIGLLFFVLFILLCGLQVNDLMNKENTENQYRQMVNLMDRVADDFKIDKHSLLSNQNVLQGNPIFKIEDEFYRIHMTNDNSNLNYLVEKMEIVFPDKIQIIK